MTWDLWYFLISFNVYWRCGGHNWGIFLVLLMFQCRSSSNQAIWGTIDTSPTTQLQELDHIKWNTNIWPTRLPRQIHEETTEASPFNPQSHTTLGLWTQNDEVADSGEETTLPKENNGKGRQQHNKESPAEWNIHGIERTWVWMQATDRQVRITQADSLKLQLPKEKSW